MNPPAHKPLPVVVTYRTAHGEHTYAEVLHVTDGAYRLLIPPEVTDAQLPGTNFRTDTE